MLLVGCGLWSLAVYDGGHAPVRRENLIDMIFTSAATTARLVVFLELWQPI